MMEKLIIDFTNTYERERYMGFETIDMTAATGCDMYCDEEAQKEILSKIGFTAGSGIHLIDSGNYHYMTRLFTSLIREPYELVFFDNHTDMKPAMFDMLSCGSWAAECLRKDENLKKMVMIGPPEKSLGELEEAARHNSKLTCISREELMNPAKATEIPAGNREGLPLYISVDKDVLSSLEVLTNWDQGTLSLDDLCGMLEKLSEGRRIIGLDICGLLPEKDASPSDFAAAMGSLYESDKKIMDAVRFMDCDKNCQD